jgi:hypothetical protein
MGAAVAERPNLSTVSASESADDEVEQLVAAVHAETTATLHVTEHLRTVMDFPHD